MTQSRHWTERDHRMTRRGILAAAAGWGFFPSQAEASARPFRVAYFETYRPLSFVDPGLKGLLVDILDEVIARQMLVPCAHEGFPWARAQSLVEQGQKDAICTIATPERLAYAVAADEPVVVAPTCIFVRSDNPRVRELEAVRTLAELRALSPSVLSYSANGWAKAKLEGFNVVWGNDFLSALRMLIAGRGDLMIENALTMEHSLGQLPNGDRVRALPNPMDQARFQLLVSKRSAHLSLLGPFSKALQKFKTTPQYADLFARYGVRRYAEVSGGRA